MNIIELEDVVKGLPDDRLFQEAQNPSGEIPQYLTISEIQRRTDMRQRYKAATADMPQQTIAQQVMSNGMASMAPPPQQPPGIAGLPQQGMAPQGMPPQGMAQGGIVALAGGGSTIVPREPSLSDWLVDADAAMKAREAYRRYQADRAEEKAIYDSNIPSFMASQYSDMPSFSKTLEEAGLGAFSLPGRRASAEVQGQSEIQTQATDKGIGSLTAGATVDPGPAGYSNKYIEMLANRANNTKNFYTSREDLIAKQAARTPELEAKYKAYADAQREAYPEIDDILDRQNRDAWSSALVQLGAGIAGDDFAGGLERAGDIGFRNKAAATQLELEDRRARAANDLAATGFELEGWKAGLANDTAVLGMTADDRTAKDAADLAQWSATNELLSSAGQLQNYENYFNSQMNSASSASSAATLGAVRDMIKMKVDGLMMPEGPEKEAKIRQIIMESIAGLPPELQRIFLADVAAAGPGADTGVVDFSNLKR